ncbi:hypothetical protein LWI29_006829 [Acer saccharum]|uniref:Uncharacterized protein n=1 Tax=Acer saccharum TaxID=4024 RepID=A0AA39S7Y3_ACESA|nr:hypothetical protein LWI29_006829 [Acer saccharum]
MFENSNSICNEHNLNISVSQKTEEMVSFEGSEPVVILEFGQMGQGLANFLSTPLASGGDGGFMGWPYVAFDLNPSVVKQQASRKLGFPTLYGDGSWLLQSAGISSPKAAMIMYTGKKKTIEAVQRLQLAFPMLGLSISLILCVCMGLWVIML